MLETVDLLPRMEKVLNVINNELQLVKSQQTIRKRVADIMDGAHEDRRAPARKARVAEAEARYADVTPETLPRAVAELETDMFRHAEQLEFEEAARVRDEIRRLKEQVLKSA